jgi:hypothetical protein
MKDTNKMCCNNCKKCFFTDKCEKLLNLTEYKALSNNEIQNFSLFNEEWLKKNEIKQNYCCDEFENIWISYPMVVEKIEDKKIEYDNKYYSSDLGKLVKIRPCKEEYKNKTFLGLSLGQLPDSINSSYYPTTHILENSTSHNPAIYVFELNKIIFGYESWWGVIKDEKELEEITDKDIDNVWYVKLLKNNFKGEK